MHVSSLFEGAKQCDATHSIGTFGSGARIAVTLYDLIPLLSPETYLGQGWTKNWYMNKVENLKRADFLLSISEHSRREAIDALGIDGGRIVNISSAHKIFFIHAMKTAQQQERLSRYGIAQPFVMYNGALESRKNLDRLLEAFALLPPTLRNAHQLVFVGKISDLDRERLQRRARSLGIYKQLVLTGYVSDRRSGGIVHALHVVCVPFAA